MRQLWTCVFAALSLGAIGCASPPLLIEEFRSHEPLSQEAPSDEQLDSWSNSYWPFCEKLYRSLSKRDSENLFVSPYIINVALSMLFEGADGSTRTEIAHALGIDEEVHVPGVIRATADRMRTRDGVPPVLQTHSAIWTQQGTAISRDFLDQMALYFDTGVQQIDFAEGDRAAAEINRWTAEKTDGAISKIADGSQYDAQTRAVLLNAIFFKDLWSEPFDRKQTRDHPFTLPNGTQVSVPMMFQEAELQYLGREDFEAVYLTYDSEAELLLILPRPGRFSEVEQQLSQNLVQEIYDAELDLYEVKLSLPRLLVRSSLSLKGALQELGMESVFDPLKANFAPLSTEPLHLSSVSQHAKLMFDEEGTVATAVIDPNWFSLSAEPSGPVTLTFDRPFLLMIFHRLQAGPLFMGRIVDPRG